MIEIIKVKEEDFNSEFQRNISLEDLSDLVKEYLLDKE